MLVSGQGLNTVYMHMYAVFSLIKKICFNFIRLMVTSLVDNGCLERVWVSYNIQCTYIIIIFAIVLEPESI